MTRFDRPVVIRAGEGWTASFHDFEDKRILILADSYGLTIAEAARRMRDADGDLSRVLADLAGD